MSRRMSVSMTLDAVRNQTKTVTRRHVDTWKNLKAGDHLTLIEKGMGLPKGAKQVVVTEVEIVDVREELLGSIHAEDSGTAREGLGHMTCSEFVRFWADGHGYASHEHPADLTCRRIEWRYLPATLRCARCDVELFDDPHTDTDLADVCDLCCTVCTPSPSGSQSPEVSPATGDAVAHDEAAGIPAGSHPKATTNGASGVLDSAGGGLSSPSPSSAPAERRTRETSETGSPRMGSTAAVTHPTKQER